MQKITNLKLIVTETAPVPSKLNKGEMAFGNVGDSIKMYANTGASIVSLPLSPVSQTTGTSTTSVMSQNAVSSLMLPLSGGTMSGNISFNTPVGAVISSTSNLHLNAGSPTSRVFVYTNGSSGISGQLLTSTGTGAEWKTVSIPSAGNIFTSAVTQAPVPAGESVQGDITLHDVSKTGSWADLLNRPYIDTNKTSKNIVIGDGDSISGYALKSTVIGNNSSLVTDDRGILIGSDSKSNGGNNIGIGSVISFYGESVIGIGNDVGIEGIQCTVVGQSSFAVGDENVLFGDLIGVTGNFNVALGSHATHSITTATNSSIMVGQHSRINSGVDSVIAVGYNVNATGDPSVLRSVGVGYNVNISGSGSVAIGNFVKSNAGIAIGSGANVKRGIAIGSGANGALTTLAESEPWTIAIGGLANSAGGISIGYSANSANAGIAIGVSSATQVGIAVGHEATAAAGIAVGTSSSANSSNSIGIGNGASVDGSFSVAIGAYSTVSAANTIRFGSSGNVTQIGSYAGWTNLSDERDKADIKPVKKCLAFINSIEPVQYVRNQRGSYAGDGQGRTNAEISAKYGADGFIEYNREEHRKGTRKGKRKRVGVLAQQVERSLNEIYGTDNYADIVHDSSYHAVEKNVRIDEEFESQKFITYQNFIPFLIGAVKELSNRVDELERKLM
jgi:hypothetical protein